jgi:hypothetical protein
MHSIEESSKKEKGIKKVDAGSFTQQVSFSRS